MGKEFCPVVFKLSAFIGIFCHLAIQIGRSLIFWQNLISLFSWIIKVMHLMPLIKRCNQILYIIGLCHYLWLLHFGNPFQHLRNHSHHWIENFKYSLSPPAPQPVQRHRTLALPTTSTHSLLWTGSWRCKARRNAQNQCQWGFATAAVSTVTEMVMVASSSC